ncbi:MAG TPA: orotidine-5'-phosphate decarboxylase, partial [Steroidobacteraceae bacterium]|nr:orotidine-5'-phosphate decarboxylase [Steroidobacteraceae bacterium]
VSFADKLAASWKATNSLVCVGLDPEPKKFPDQFRDAPGGIFQFNRAIIDATRDLVCAYKPQFAYYAAHAAENQLEHTIDYIKSTCPNALVILDSKRGDIGSTAEQYALEAFERYGADAVTVNPYLGYDSVEPFLKHEDKGVIILCRTSNPGAKDFQDLDVGGKKLFQHVAETVAKDWNTAGNCMLVVGATYPEELADIRTRVGDLPLLVPGVGAQGGDVAKVMAAGKTQAGTGLVISSSRAILYASSGANFAEAARKAATELRDSINAQR